MVSMEVDSHEQDHRKALLKTVASLRQIGGALRANANDIAATKSASGTDEDTTSLAASAAGATLLVELKGKNREAFTLAEQVERAMEDAKAKVEDKHLGLQNLLYEKAYLLREIERCNQFHGEVFDRIELLPLDKFEESAPQEMLENIKSLPEASIERDHQIAMSRLSHELLVRKSLCKQLEELKLKKQQVQDETLKQQAFLDDLPGKIAAITAASADIQKHFGQPILERLGRHELCGKLPQPLYMVYAQLEAYGDTFGGVTVNIEANPEHSSSASTKMEISDGGNDQDEAEPSRSAKRQRTFSAKPLKTFNLGVKAHLQSSSHQVNVTLWFEYFEDVNVVTVETVGRVGLLTNLYENDTGQFLPHIVMNSEDDGTPRPGTARRQVFPAEYRGRPFKWLQWLSGIYNLSAEGPYLSSQPSTRNIVKTILSRVRAQESLSEQLALLEKCPHPVPVHSSAESLFPPSASTRLVRWEEIEAAEADKRIGETSVTSVNDVVVFYRENAKNGSTRGARGQDGAANFGRRCFRGALQLGGSSKGKICEAIVQVFVDYPRSPPMFTLFLGSDSDTETVQREVNEYASELMAGNQLNLLSHQLRRLQMCLDVVANGGSKSPEDADGADSRGEQSSTIDRKRRGRDRRLAFVYDPVSRGFIHR